MRVCDVHGRNDVPDCAVADAPAHALRILHGALALGALASGAGAGVSPAAAAAMAAGAGAAGAASNAAAAAGVAAALAPLLTAGSVPSATTTGGAGGGASAAGGGAGGGSGAGASGSGTGGLSLGGGGLTLPLVSGAVGTGAGDTTHSGASAGLGVAGPHGIAVRVHLAGVPEIEGGAANAKKQAHAKLAAMEKRAANRLLQSPLLHALLAAAGARQSAGGSGSASGGAGAAGASGVGSGGGSGGRNITIHVVAVDAPWRIVRDIATVAAPGVSGALTSLEDAWASLSSRLGADGARYRKAVKEALELSCSPRLRDSPAPLAFYSLPEDRFDAAL